MSATYTITIEEIDEIIEELRINYANGLYSAEHCEQRHGELLQKRAELVANEKND